MEKITLDFRFEVYSISLAELIMFAHEYGGPVQDASRYHVKKTEGHYVSATFSEEDAVIAKLIFGKYIIERPRQETMHEILSMLKAYPGASDKYEIKIIKNRNTSKEAFYSDLKGGFLE
jgi:hypothetical protein